jgi:hypothetical protein
MAQLTRALFAARKQAAERPPESYWSDLFTENTARFDAAAASLGAHPNETLELLDKLLRPSPPMDRDRVQKLIRDVYRANSLTQARAMADIDPIIQGAAVDLRRLYKSMRKSTEYQWMKYSDPLDELFKAMSTAKALPDQMRALRAIGIMEQIASPKATEKLRELASGASIARVTTRAHDALERLARH